MASMKLRFRAAAGGPTVRLQIPVLCSLQGAKDALAPFISLPASSFSLSLNKKNEIHGPGGALLSSFGVNSGDLVYYIVNQAGVSDEEITGWPLTHAETSNRESRDGRPISESKASTFMELEVNPTTTIREGGRAVSAPSTRRELYAAARASLVAKHPVFKFSDSIPAAGAASSSQRIGSAAEGTRNNLIEETKGAQQRGKPQEDYTGHSLMPIPDLLQRVLSLEIGNVHQASAYLVLAIHAVMLETGFVMAHSSGNCGPALEEYRLPLGWSTGGLVSLVYTLPDLVRPTESPSGVVLGDEALLRCQIVGDAVVVYGAVTGGSVYLLSLSVLKFLRENVKIPEDSGRHSMEDDSPVDDMEEVFSIEAETCDSCWAHENIHVGSSADNDENVSVFLDIFELWKEVKDRVSLPLMTVMCERAGLSPPPSLLRLPTELKTKVLDSLSSVSLANLSCVCSELRFLAASEDLWKQKYREEFGANGEKAPGGRSWKTAFVREFNHRKRREEERREAEMCFRGELFTPGIILRPPSFTPNLSGLDYFQRLGGPSRGGFGSFAADIEGGGFRSFAYRGGYGNPTVFRGNWMTGRRLDVDLRDYGDENGICYPGLDFDGSRIRSRPALNSAGRGSRSVDRLDAGGGFGIGQVLEYQRRLG